MNVILFFRFMGRKLAFICFMPSLERFVFAVLILFLFGSFDISVIAQSYFTTSGSIELIRYKLEDLQEGRNPKSNKIDVVCIAGADKWRIDMTQESGGDQFFFDGTNLYDNIIIKKKVKNPASVTSKSAIISSSKAGERISTTCANTWQEMGFSPQPTNVSASNHDLPERFVYQSGAHIWHSDAGLPYFDSRINVPWLAFCSGTYLKKAKRRIPFPIVNSRHSPDSLAYRDITRTFDDDFGLPSKIDLFASDALFDASVTNGAFEGNHDPAIWRRGSVGFKWDLPDGSFRFRYVVTSFTNIGSWSVPLTFELYLNIPESNKLITVGHGVFSAPKACQAPLPVIDPARTMSVVDWRLKDEKRGANATIYSPNKSTTEGWRSQ